MQLQQIDDLIHSIEDVPGLLSDSAGTLLDHNRELLAHCMAIGITDTDQLTMLVKREAE